MKKLLLLWLGIAMLSPELNAQDPQFSQFYANPLYLNPAFTGTKGCGRMNLNYRDQWPQLSGEFVTYSASYDQHSSIANGGLGLLISSDNAGKGNLITNRVGAIYSYAQNLNKDYSFSLAMQADLEQKSLNATNIILGDRIDPVKGISPVLGEVVASKTVVYPDFSTGAIIYSKYLQAGVAVHHLFEPKQNFLVGPPSVLPRKYTAHMGVTIPLNRRINGKNSDSYISPQVIFQQQKDFRELNLGVFVKKGPLTGGLFYRTRDALIASVALQTNHLRVGYSYDVTLSNLSTAAVGSHELALGYSFQCKQKKKKPRPLNCPGWD